jgi:hypothetical protein
VVIHYLYVFSAGDCPSKTEPPLIVDADAVLTGPITFQCLEPVAWRHPQIIQPSRDFKLPELAAGHGGYVYETPDALATG